MTHPLSFSRFGVLNVPSSTPPRPSRRKHHWAQHLATLATKPGEKCGLAVILILAGCPFVWASAFPPGHEMGIALERPCTPCHEAHGEPDTPMLSLASDQLCLHCHESAAGSASGRRERGIVPSANPQDIRTQTEEASNHTATGCRSCHSLHHRYESLGGLNPTVVGGVPLQSTKKGFADQAELCLSCHSRTGDHTNGVSQSDIGGLLRLENRSYHPILVTAPERSPSVIPELVSAIINCTDCHGNDVASGPKGPHGSRVDGLLRSEYTQIDGSSESVQVYALCYACHDRDKVLDSEAFPVHDDHIVDEQTSCTTCHDAHGSVTRRALIRFGEEITPNGVSPSLSTGRLEYISDGAGSGACYLSCHGVDHGPEAYGSMKGLLEMLGREGLPGDRRLRSAPVAPNRSFELD